MDKKLQRQLEELDDEHRFSKKKLENKAEAIEQEKSQTRRALDALYERHQYYLQELNPDFTDRTFQHELEKESGNLMQQYQNELQQLSFAFEEQEDTYCKQKRRLEDNQ